MFFQTPAAAFFNKESVIQYMWGGDNVRLCASVIVDCFQWGFRTLVPEDCVGDQAEGPHRDNLRDVERRYCDLTTADSAIDQIQAWSASKARSFGQQEQ
ncbi:MAG: hypothetical protein Ct9H300mP14_02710 [Gammaproteobacteria bacterium]|nr:MAG: hypothetical protein Ct9H300mP14_02710 [Gammaproteobacteria bacterium]